MTWTLPEDVVAVKIKTGTKAKIQNLKTSMVPKILVA